MRAIPTLTVNEQTYELTLDGNAHEAIEEATGRSILDNTWQPQTIQELGLFLWACTRTSAPHLTVEQVMANLGMAHVPFVLEAIAEIMLSQTGDTESDKRSLAPFVATPPQVAEATLFCPPFGTRRGPWAGFSLNKPGTRNELKAGVLNEAGSVRAKVRSHHR